MKSFKQFINEAVSSSDLKSMLKKYGYGGEPEELAFALGDESMETMTMDQIIKKINKQRMSKADVEKKLKAAVGESTEHNKDFLM